MSKFVIEGGNRLSGEITPQGAKNEALQIISATLLTSEVVEVNNIPDILDIRNLIALLGDMGVKIVRLDEESYSFQADDINLEYISSDEFVRVLPIDSPLTGSGLVAMASLSSAIVPIAADEANMTFSPVAFTPK